MHLKSSLAQWRALQAVVDEGGFAKASSVLNRSQSSVSYAVSKLEESLGLSLLRLDGRRARLTQAGDILLRAARNLLEEAAEVEALAASLAQGREPELRIAVDEIVPAGVLNAALADFAREAPGTRVEIREEVLSGAQEALMLGEVDLALCPEAPTGFLGEPLLDVDFLPVAHPNHPLFAKTTALTGDDLSRELQLVIRDSARRDRKDWGWLGSPRRWTVGSLTTALGLVASGTGFAWIPKHQLEEALASHSLKVLPLADGGGKRNHIYLVQRHAQTAGPALRALVTAIRSHASGWHDRPRSPENKSPR